jgi:hypothetical protein
LEIRIDPISEEEVGFFVYFRKKSSRPIKRRAGEYKYWKEIGWL